MFHGLSPPRIISSKHKSAIRSKCGTLKQQLRKNNWICGLLAAVPVMGWRLLLYRLSGESRLTMEVELYVGNLSKLITQAELNVLFSRAGDVTSVDIVKDRKTGESNGFAFVTMSAQSEADKAVSMFNAYPLNNDYLRVLLIRSRQQRAQSAQGRL